MNRYVDISLSPSQLDVFFIRKSISLAIEKEIPEFHGSLLDIGCGRMPYKKFIKANSAVDRYVGLDIEGALEYDPYVQPDFTWDGNTMPFEDAAFECAIGTEVLEHCFEPEVILKETHRVLKDGGTFFFTVPFLWNLHEAPHDAYRYTPFALSRLLDEAGFTEISIKAYGGWHASMGQMIGLWVRRATRPGIVRGCLSVLLLPLMKVLFWMDRKTFGHTNFENGTMIPGLYGTAKKSAPTK